MELQNPTFWELWSSLHTLLMLLVAVAMNLSVMHVSAANYYRNETDRLALLEFKNQIFEDPYGVLNSWNYSQNHCQWHGITCDTRHRRVTALALRGNSLSGTISPHIGNLSFMKFIQLEENQFHGEIPQEVGHLFRLRFLNLSINRLSGKIPFNLSRCSQMTYISLTSNNLEGRIPVEILNLKKLEYLYISKNNLTGEIPSSTGNLSALTVLSLGYNNLEGSLPRELGLLTRLSVLRVALNKLTGVFPASVFNISTIVTISGPDNSFHGNLPTKIGLAVPSLQALTIGGNKMNGNIPISITNASVLDTLDLSDNNFAGQVPSNIGDLSRLQTLKLGGNLLGSNSTSDLSFIPSLTNNSNLRILGLYRNNFGGKIPKEMANLSFQLTGLAMGNNQLTGTIPDGLGNLVNLYAFDVGNNSLSGGIPSDFGKLRNLQFLGFAANRLSGELPSSLHNLTSLYMLELSSNRFEGNLSESLGNYKSLQYLNVHENNFSGIISPWILSTYLSLEHLNLANNSFSGSLPLEIGKLKHLQVLNISHNKFSGEIPPSIVDCSNLENLDMQDNFFQGRIPPNLGYLKSIQQLDLSSNNLIGKIPKDLEKLQFLNYLDLSYNDLEGEVPTTGVFGNASQITLIGNGKLCGGIPELNLPSCPIVQGKKKRNLKVIIIVFSTISPMIIMILGTLFYILICNKRCRTRESFSIMPTRVNKLLRVSYHELHRATSGFSPENLVGSGSFGVVYKGRLDRPGDNLVAIKVLDLQQGGALKSFKAECNALRNIRHRNLVSIISYCSSINPMGLEFKALVYEFMENGNLDMWLHPETTDEGTRSRSLNVFQRLNIAIDVASALNYLHNQCVAPIVHCDLKPSNILLDNDLVAHVGDFGLAKLLAKITDSSSEEGISSSIAIRGTFGYAAPEYGMGVEVSIQRDIYAYGILLLEMFTRKRPTDEMFKDGLDLHNYVKRALPDQVSMIVDPLLLPKKGCENEEVSTHDKLNIDDEKKDDFLSSILRIGINCSATLPNDRMPMNVIVRKLHLLRDGFLGSKMK